MEGVRDRRGESPAFLSDMNVSTKDWQGVSYSRAHDMTPTATRLARVAGFIRDTSNLRAIDCYRLVYEVLA